MKVYGITKLGRKVIKRCEGSNPELRILQFLRENKTGTEDELKIVAGEGYIIRKLERQGLIKELTT